MHHYAFFFRNLCNVSDVFIEYFKACGKSECFRDVVVTFHEAKSPMDAREHCIQIDVSFKGVNAVSGSAFALYVFQNTKSEVYGLEITELKISQPAFPTGSRDVKQMKVCRSAEDSIALEEFRTFLHIQFSRCACRRKHGNRALGYPASDVEAAAAHYQGITDSVALVAESSAEANRKVDAMQSTIRELSAEIAQLKAAMNTPVHNASSDALLGELHKRLLDDETRKRQRISE